MCFSLCRGDCYRYLRGRAWIEASGCQTCTDSIDLRNKSGREENRKVSNYIEMVREEKRKKSNTNKGG